MSIGLSRDDYDTRGLRQLTAIAERDQDAIEDLVLHDESWRQHTGGGELRGLLLRGGNGDVPFVHDNAWGVPCDAGLSEALEHVWRPVARHCPNFLSVMHAEVFGLALTRATDGDRLGYLYLHRYSDRTGPPRELAELAAHAENGFMDVLWGGPSLRHDPQTPFGALGEPVPASIRELAVVHSSLNAIEGGMAFDALDETVRDHIIDRYADEDEDVLVEEARQGEYDHYVAFGGSDPAAENSILDLERRDPLGEPLVGRYSADDGLFEGDASFWDWFDENAPHYLFNGQVFLAG
ncbi:hypothetical protein B7C62_13635 [Kitasatospora albolonga]|uniref:DUF1963 domain-containing protein n=1 Tax=Kitasatospora albolonga TaxID=68173 RepID=A0ABC8BSF5_9ACTN|nr:hypothetical protein B7C62_13635 [Kitasatospora albolonga]